ncbi:unnamed protein product [Owenia fusiformis]|uniref:Peptidase S1 domain-containing protein n=1 Tax=Owenia fusiformis TaxID=6347 RepID=A0A8S4NKS4_OWEFU|nr:unnamed protein product [Owenia fusiformis]
MTTNAKLTIYVLCFLGFFGVNIVKAQNYRWSAWSRWSECMTSSDLEHSFKLRRRYCMEGENVVEEKLCSNVNECSEFEIDWKICLFNDADVKPPEWSAWGAWSGCSANECIPGRRTRKCIKEGTTVDDWRCGGRSVDENTLLCDSCKDPGDGDMVDVKSKFYTDMKYPENDTELVKASQRSRKNTYGSRYTPEERAPFSWVVSLSDDKREHFCSGVILSDRWIMTAGHCMCPDENDDCCNPDKECDMSEWIVTAGTRNVLNKDQNIVQTRSVERGILHKDYKHLPENDEMDIALIKIKIPFNFTYDYVQPCLLPASTCAKMLPDGTCQEFDTWGEYKDCKAAGWSGEKGVRSGLVIVWVKESIDSKHIIVTETTRPAKGKKNAQICNVRTICTGSI